VVDFGGFWGFFERFAKKKIIFTRGCASHIGISERCGVT
jgi:hypothetical protein